MSETQHFQVDGMSCAGCATRLEKSLGSIPGVVSVKANHETGHISLVADKTIVSGSIIKTAIEDAGFDLV